MVWAEVFLEEYKELESSILAPGWNLRENYEQGVSQIVIPLNKWRMTELFMVNIATTIIFLGTGLTIEHMFIGMNEH